MGVYVMAGELHEMSVAIGRLQEGMKNLTDTLHEERESTRDEHRKVHDIVVATSEAVRNLTRDVAKILPDIEEYRNSREQAKGAAKLAKFLYVTGGGLASVGFYRVMDLFASTPKPPHP